MALSHRSSIALPVSPASNHFCKVRSRFSFCASMVDVSSRGARANHATSSLAVSSSAFTSHCRLFLVLTYRAIRSFFPCGGQDRVSGLLPCRSCGDTNHLGYSEVIFIRQRRCHSCLQSFKCIPVLQLSALFIRQTILKQQHIPALLCSPQSFAN